MHTSLQTQPISLATSAQVETLHEYEMSFNLRNAQYWIKRVEHAVFKLY